MCSDWLRPCRQVPETWLGGAGQLHLPPGLSPRGVEGPEVTRDALTRKEGGWMELTVSSHGPGDTASAPE